ncbi:MAG TPA: hypothetical protein VM262_19810 [Acidimicrobiales bacterium]|nr:hypothetical protein [Acidimicrobiales bacterium]
MTAEELVELVARSRADQGLPATVTDPVALEAVAVALATTPIGGGADAVA